MSSILIYFVENKSPYDIVAITRLKSGGFIRFIVSHGILPKTKVFESLLKFLGLKM